MSLVLVLHLFEVLEEEERVEVGAPLPVQSIDDLPLMGQAFLTISDMPTCISQQL
ncbi:hypothetical protein IVB22_25990 [Bradyrhizobium sp. 190]|uniref:hypothetical protein n=1 Tax=Bradyrhizobium sp. 190 TaxID=2782658 RepID=UPI001FFA0048|nr:hypothetical protein [Bradyrhizobium sp. 190]MCK1515949.1 hypothetical protein [Bradyrhizobium sp. 190]